MPVSATTPTSAAPREERPLLDGAAWTRVGQQHGVTITDEKTAGRIRRPELSWSQAANLGDDSCQAQMALERLLPRDDDAFEANQLGTAAHGALEQLLQLPHAERTKERVSAIILQMLDDEEFCLTLLDKDLTARLRLFTPAERELWINEVTTRAHGLWSIEDPKNVDVFATELGFGKRQNRIIHVGRVPFIGFIDRVDEVRDENGTVIGLLVRDYKMGHWKDGRGRYGDDYGDQVRVYAVASANETGYAIYGGALYFCAAEKGRDIDLSTKSVEAAVARFERAWDRMHAMADANFFPVKVGPLCSWCKLVNACPAALAEGKKDLSNTEKVNGQRVVVEGKKLKGLPAADLAHVPTLAKPAAPFLVDKKFLETGIPTPGFEGNPADAETPFVPAAGERPLDLAFGSITADFADDLDFELV